MLLAAALLQYLIVTVLLTVVIVVIATASGLIHPEWTALPQIAAYMALGCSMFVSLLLQSFASRIFPLVICAAALALEILLRDLWVLGQIMVTTELLIVLTGYAALVLGSAERHAC
jgi:hypothetical protein